MNGINNYICYSHFQVPKNFTLVEKAVIAYNHPVISIIKLELSSISVSISYLRICGHFVVLLWQLDLLLNLLPLNNLQVHDIIRVVSLKKCSYYENDVQYFGWIKKVKVFKALL